MRGQKTFYRYGTPLECRVLDVVISIDISRLWREEMPYLPRGLLAPAEQYVYRILSVIKLHSSGVLCLQYKMQPDFLRRLTEQPNEVFRPCSLNLCRNRFRRRIWWILDR